MNIYESICAIMSDCPAISKDSRNTQGNGYNYRGIDAVMNALQPLLIKHKVFVVPNVYQSQREERVTSKGNTLIYSIIRVEYTFYAEDGSYLKAFVMDEGMDSGDKATNKAMSAAFKYALFQVFCIPTEEMHDPDAETPEESQKAVICSVCGEPVKPLTGNRGKTYSPSEVLEKLGMCSDCYKVSQIAEGKK